MAMRLRLTELNQQLSTSRGARFIGLFVFVLALAGYLTYTSFRFGLNGPPTTGGDEPDYDSLGWELSQGRGYQFNFADPAFREPYDAAAQAQPQHYTLPTGRYGPTAYRPPLLPFVLAGTDVLFGRQFWAIRLINIACMAATCGLVAHCVLRTAGVLPALLGAFIFVVIDSRTRLYARAVLTEAMACLLVALLAIVLIQAARRRARAWVIVAGVLTGLSVLARNIFAIWIPGIAWMVYLTANVRLDQARPRDRLAPAALFLATTLFVLLPWMVRNCLALGAFMPLGIQGLNELSAGYSDQAFENQGIWYNAATGGFFDGIKDSDAPPLEQEREQAQLSSGKAKRWILENPGKALLLVPLKIFHEFRPRRPSEWFLFSFALGGLTVMFQRIEGWVFAGLLLMNVAAVGATWSVEGRFLVPLLFVFHVLAAVGLWSTLLVLTGNGGWVMVKKEVDRRTATLQEDG